MSAPHILLANIFFAPFTYGGATVVAEEVARHLQRDRGLRISAVSLVSRQELAPYTITKSHAQGIDNYLINVPGTRSYKDVYDDPQLEAVFADLAQQIGPDLLHMHCIQEMGIGLLRAGKALGLPMVLSVHDFWWICERQFMLRLDEVYCAQHPVDIEACKGCVPNLEASRIRFKALSEAAALADIVTYPSQFALDLCEASGLAPGQGVVWENGVHLPGPDFPVRQQARRQRDPRLTFGFVGGPSHLKGWPLIRQAFAALSREDFRVCVVDGTQDGSWWRGHDLSRLPGHWQVIPRYEQSEMDAFYAEIDVLLFLSQWKETFGLTIREALARGIHVIQTDSGGTTEHGRVERDALIPIGAPAERLQAQIEPLLSDGLPPRPATPVKGFADQASHFLDLIAPYLSRS